MNAKLRQCLQSPQGLLAALAITALAALGSPGTASASTTAGTTIINIVQVDYKDATGLGTDYHAAFSTTVTVNLVKSGLNITTPPNSDAIPGFGCAPQGSYASGDHFIAYYALTAAANGQDTYNLSIGQTRHNASASTSLYSLLKYDGTELAAATSAPSTRKLNSAIVVGTSGDDILLFPGGSLKAAAAGGLAQNDIVVVEYATKKTAYLVESVTLGNAKGYTVNATSTGGLPSSTTGAKTDEVQDQVKVKAFANNSLGIGSGVGALAAAPAFLTSAPAVGTVVGQMVLAKIDVTATTSVIGAGNDAYVDYTLTTTDSSTQNPAYVGAGGPPAICDAGLFLSTQLTIIKTVENITDAGRSAAGTSNPGDFLDYVIVVNNPGGQANLVSISDNIPPYTKLVTFSVVHGTGTQINTYSGVFASITNGTGNVVDAKVDGTTVAPQPGGVQPAIGYGTAAGVAANSALKFYLGEGSSSSAGGTVPSCSDKTKNTLAACTGAGTSWIRTYNIRYRVQVD